MNQSMVQYRVDRFSDRRDGHPNRPATQTILGTIIGNSIMKQIDISTSKHPNTFILVDDEDFVEVSVHKWFVSRGYAVRNKGYGVQSRMHREIMNAPKELQVDHINHNRLDNRKQNLRLCTNAENAHNSRTRKDNTSGFKGVCWHKQERKWYAYIRVDGRGKSLGLFFCLIKAAVAYDKAAIKHFKEYARLNFPYLLKGK